MLKTHSHYRLVTAAASFDCMHHTKPSTVCHCYPLLDVYKVCHGVIVRVTSLHCRWRTRAMQCLRPTMLYTDVDGQCDKLVTETVTSLPHWSSN